MKNKKASVLMISLWILAILVILAITIGHRAVISLKLARNQRDGLKAYLYAKSGVYKAVAILKEDAELGSPAENYDTKEACGVNLEDKEPETFFVQEFENGTGDFTVAYYDSKGEVFYGMSDEYGKVNINISTDAQNNKFERDVVIDLFTNYDIGNADELVDTIIAWIDPNAIISKAKKENFNSLEELLLVFEYYYREVNKDLTEDPRKQAQITYAKIKDSLRVVGDKKININTASDEIITAFSSATAKTAPLPPGIDLNDYLTAANQLVVELTDYLKGYLFKSNSELDVFLNSLTDPAEKNIAGILRPLLEVKSDFFRIESTGISGRIEKKITAIYDRPNKSFLYWKEN
ncbi:MAG: hypothetical protein ABIH18_02545 [Candidatus Omnitrophota bacterium]